jgi:hypothetical protein
MNSDGAAFLAVGFEVYGAEIGGDFEGNFCAKSTSLAKEENRETSIAGSAGPFLKEKID